MTRNWKDVRAEGERRREEPDFEAECRRNFARYCGLYAVASYHSEKRYYVDKAYEVIEAWLDFRDVQSL